MNSPIVLLVGQAGSGKDTVASFLVKNHGAVAIAQADPMKRLARLIFDFTEEQLWGPSETRNAPDLRFDNPRTWDKMWDDASVQLRSRYLIEEVMRATGAVSADDLDEAVSGFKLWLRKTNKRTMEGAPLTPRYVLQTMGTEWGRFQNRDIWSNYSIACAKKVLGGGYYYSRVSGLNSDLSARPPARVVITDGRFRNEVLNVLYVGGSTVRIESVTDAAAVAAAGVQGHASEEEQKSIPGQYFGFVFKNDKSAGLEACERGVSQLVASMDGKSVQVSYSGPVEQSA